MKLPLPCVSYAAASILKLPRVFNPVAMSKTLIQKGIPIERFSIEEIPDTLEVLSRYVKLQTTLDSEIAVEAKIQSAFQRVKTISEQIESQAKFRTTPQEVEIRQNRLQYWVLELGKFASQLTKKILYEMYYGTRLTQSFAGVLVVDDTIEPHQARIPRDAFNGIGHPTKSFLNTYDPVLLWRQPIIGPGSFIIARAIPNEHDQWTIGLHPSRFEAIGGDCDGDVQRGVLIPKEVAKNLKDSDFTPIKSGTTDLEKSAGYSSPIGRLGNLALSDGTSITVDMLCSGTDGKFIPGTRIPGSSPAIPDHKAVDSARKQKDGIGIVSNLYRSLMRLATSQGMDPSPLFCIQDVVQTVIDCAKHGTNIDLPSITQHFNLVKNGQRVYPSQEEFENGLIPFGLDQENAKQITIFLWKHCDFPNRGLSKVLGDQDPLYAFFRSPNRVELLCKAIEPAELCSASSTGKEEVQ